MIHILVARTAHVVDGLVHHLPRTYQATLFLLLNKGQLLELEKFPLPRVDRDCLLLRIWLLDWWDFHRLICWIQDKASERLLQIYLNRATPLACSGLSWLGGRG